MTQEEYLDHLSKVTGIAVPKEVAVDEAEELFSGLFQKYRPAGEGLEKVFAPLQDGVALHERMKRIFYFDLARGEGNHYFIPQAADAHLEDTLAPLVDEFRQNLLWLLQGKEFEEARNMLHAIEDQEHLPEEELYTTDSDEYAILFDALSDWEMDHLDEDHPIALLEEAYYSVNMDPWLVLWMKWPVIGKGIERDVFEPYFQMWSLGGYSCRPVGKIMMVGR
jgi:hypothetical protein